MIAKKGKSWARMPLEKMPKFLWRLGFQNKPYKEMEKWVFERRRDLTNRWPWKNHLEEASLGSNIRWRGSPRGPGDDG